MSDLITALDCNNVSLEIAKLAFETTPPGCKLRDFMAEELVDTLSRHRYKFDDLEIFNGIPGFIPEFKAALDKEAKGGGLGTIGINSDRESWARFMVAGGPTRYYITEKCPNCET